MQRVKDTGKRPRPRSTNSRLPNGWLAGCSSGRKQFPLPTDAAAQETLKRKEERAGHGPSFLTLAEQAFTRLASGVYSGNCLWPLSLPSLPLCLECKPSVLGSMFWNNVDGGHLCAKCLQLGRSRLGNDYLLAELREGGPEESSILILW